MQARWKFWKKKKTRIRTILAGEFIDGRSYIVSGKLGNNGMSKATLHITIRRPEGKEYQMDINTDKNGNFCTEVIADIRGSYIISVEYVGVAKHRITSTDISLTVGVIEVPALPEFLKDQESKRIHI